MTTKRHSKTPWRLVKNTDMHGNLCYYSIISHDRKTVSEVFIQDSTKGEVSEEETANAYLITAAPKLLETLELVEAWLLATRQGNDMVGLISYTILEAKGKIGIDNPKDTLL